MRRRRRRRRKRRRRSGGGGETCRRRMRRRHPNCNNIIEPRIDYQKRSLRTASAVIERIQMNVLTNSTILGDIGLVILHISVPLLANIKL